MCYTLRGDSSNTAETSEATEACWRSTTSPSVSLTAMAAAAEPATRENPVAGSALSSVFACTLSCTLTGGCRDVLFEEDAEGARGGTPLPSEGFGASGRGALAGAWSIRMVVINDLHARSVHVARQDSAVTATYVANTPGHAGMPYEQDIHRAEAYRRVRF